MNTKLNLLCATLALAISGSVVAAPLSPSAEFGLSNPGLEKSVLLPTPDLAKLKMEDSKAVGGPYRYGIQIPLQGMRLNAKDATGGAWRNLKDGRRVWQWSVVSPGAKSLDFHFSRMNLPADAALYIRNLDGTDVRGPFNLDNLPPEGGLWSPYVLGDHAVIEVITTREGAEKIDIELASVTHGYRGLFEQRDDLQKSGSCNVDVACPAGDGWGDQIDSVGHYTFSQGSSSYVCTGTLIANAAQDTTPYFLTANHCISSGSVANSVVVYWNYQSSTCRTPGSSSSGSPLSRSIATHSQSGASLVANYSNSDFALLRLSTAVPSGADAFWSGWDASGSTPSGAVGIHHPAGHEKRIAVEDQALTVSGYSGASGTTHWRVNDWDQGTTEGGSSGSGLWNPAKRLVGQLHGGSAACGNNLSDYYGRLSMSWTGGGAATSRLRDWLNPTGSNTTMDGYRAGGTTPPPPPPTGTVLTKGVAVGSLSGATGSELAFTMSVPSGASNLTFNISGGTGDADLYVRFGSAPTTSTYDCRPYLGGNAETCTIATPSAGTYHVMLRAYSAFSGVSLVGDYSTGGGGTQPSFFENTNNYNITDNATVESPISVSGRTGNAPTGLKVNVRIIHTYKGDLKVDLVAPDGTVYNVHNRSGGSTDNIITTYTVNASSEAANGSWKLRVNDNAGGDVGYIDSWSLQF